MAQRSEAREYQKDAPSLRPNTSVSCIDINQDLSSAQ
jgi:hypothetical protein